MVLSLKLDFKFHLVYILYISTHRSFFALFTRVQVHAGGPDFKKSSLNFCFDPEARITL